MPGDGRFQKGFDARRNMHGCPVEKHRSTIERNLEAAKIDKDVEKQIVADKTMPLDYMLRRMRDPRMNESERFIAAKAAAPYVHPQLQAVAHQHLGADGKPIAPMVTVVVMETPAEQPRLTHEGPKTSDKVQ
jgi:hypothetical protein